MIDATPLLRAYAASRRAALAMQKPVLVQRAALQRLLRRAHNTRFGRDHGFLRVASVGEYQNQVPLRRYEDFWQEYWKPRFPNLRNVTWPGAIPYFAATSGTTTGTTKYIPVSRAMLKSNGRAVLETFTHHLSSYPQSRLLAGKNFMLGGSTALVQHDAGVFSGDLSGIAANEVPWWVRPRYFPPRDIGLMPDWDRKMDVLAPLALQEDIRSLGGTPRWLLLFFARLAELRPGLPPRSSSYFPNLELFIHGGVNFAPYRTQFDNLFAGARVDMREVYPASEGFIAVADRGYGEGLRLILDNGLFYEFVPVEEIDSPHPVRHWIGDAELGINYAIVLSTNAGLWSYVLGDTVRLVGLSPPRLLITGRLSYYLSAFGEHLIEEEITAAITVAARDAGSQVVDYTVAPVFPASPNDKGGHLFVVEFAAPACPAALGRFARTLDKALSMENADYRDHRAGMRAPHVVAVRPGAFAAWMRQRGKLGGQNKVPRVMTDESLFSQLRSYLEANDAICGTAG
jgi:hypothetical protein